MCGEDFLPLCHDSSEWEIKLMDPEEVGRQWGS